MAQTRLPAKRTAKASPSSSCSSMFPNDDAGSSVAGGAAVGRRALESALRVLQRPAQQPQVDAVALRRAGVPQTVSVRVGTPLQGSPLAYQIWVVAIYLLTTSAEGTEQAYKLHRDLKVTQKTAWFLAHRIRNSFAAPGSRSQFCRRRGGRRDLHGREA